MGLLHMTWLLAAWSAIATARSLSSDMKPGQEKVLKSTSDGVVIKLSPRPATVQSVSLVQRETSASASPSTPASQIPMPLPLVHTAPNPNKGLEIPSGGAGCSKGKSGNGSVVPFCAFLCQFDSFQIQQSHSPNHDFERVELRR